MNPGETARWYYNRTHETKTDDYMLVVIVKVEYRRKAKGYIVLNLAGSVFWASAGQLEAENV